MSTALFLSIFLYSITQCTFDGTTQQSVHLYHKENFQEALDAYQNISKKNVGILFNIGNCLYHQKQYAQAIVMWREVIKKGSQAIAKKAYHSIEKVREEQGLPRSSHNSTKQEQFFEFTRTLDLFFLQLLFLIIWVACIGWLFYSKRRLIWGFILLSLITIIGIVCYDNYHERTSIHAIVLVPDATIYIGPAFVYAATGTTHYLDELNILDQKDGWYKIKSKLVYGWISEQKVTTVDKIIKSFV
jgi:tetratricopeptide (TPR) repeat protein